MRREDLGALRAADTAAREAARTTFDRPVVLEAGAGTGKTAVLVARALTWALGPGWRRAQESVGDADPETCAARVLRRMVAVTFTEAAAAEMADRIGEGLRAVGRGKGLDGMPFADLGLDANTAGTRAAALLTCLDRLTVTTIHAFCRKLLADWTLEAGVHPRFEVDAQGLHLKAAVDEALDAWIARAYGTDQDEDAIVLASGGKGPDRIRAALIALAQKGLGTDGLEGDPYPEDEVRSQFEAFLPVLRDMIAQTEVFLMAKGSLGIARETVTFLKELEPLASAGDLRSMCEKLSSWEKPRKRLKEWGKVDFKKTEAKVLVADAETVSRTAIDVRDRLKVWERWDPELAPRLRRVLRDLLRDVERRMAARGALLFPDLLTSARDLLASHPLVRDRVRRQWDQILLDEFQDTDPVQYELVMRLALEGPPEERPGLFLVGDPKQSIYGWRQADLRAYAAFLKTLPAEHARLSLTVNFRSVPAVLDHVRRLVEPAMVEEVGVQPGFERLLPCERLENDEGITDGDRRPVEHWLSRDPHGDSTRSGDAREREAAAIAQDIRELHEGGHPWRNSAILLRAFTTADPYLQALREAGIPFLVEGDRNFFRRREIQDTVSLVRTIIDPHDHVALVGFLRSVAVGVPDAALVPLWKQGLPDLMLRLRRPDDADVLRQAKRVVESAKENVPPGIAGMDRIPNWDASLLAALRSLATLRHEFLTESADHFIRRVRDLLQLDVLEAARYLGVRRVTNLERLLRRLLAALGTGNGGADAVVRELRTAVDERFDEPEASAEDVDTDAVRVLTIHMAKGLDFDNVYVPDLHHRRFTGDTSSVTQIARDPAGTQWASCLLGIPDAGWAAVAAHEEKVYQAETVRLLYVATTRAKKRQVLVYLGHGDDKDRPLEALVAAACPSRPRDARADPEDAPDDDAPASAVDTEGILWRVLEPAPEARPEIKRGEAAAESETFSDSDLERLLEQRVRAKERQKLPLVASASSDSHEAWDGQVRVRDDDEDADDAPLAALVSRDDPTHARELGTVIHRVLEDMDLEKPPDEEIARLGKRAAIQLKEVLPRGAVRRTTGRARKLLKALETSKLLARLRELRRHILGREVPLLAAGDDGEPTQAGLIDLLYRDPETDQIVVADYKTDHLSSEADLLERVRIYGDQGRTYCQAVKDALDLPDLPPFELWFLAHDRIHRTPPSASRPEGDGPERTPGQLPFEWHEEP